VTTSKEVARAAARAEAMVTTSKEVARVVAREEATVTTSKEAARAAASQEASQEVSIIHSNTLSPPSQDNPLTLPTQAMAAAVAAA
jgi:hypothetical protein